MQWCWLWACTCLFALWIFNADQLPERDGNMQLALMSFNILLNDAKLVSANALNRREYWCINRIHLDRTLTKLFICYSPCNPRWSCMMEKLALALDILPHTALACTASAHTHLSEVIMDAALYYKVIYAKYKTHSRKWMRKILHKWKSEQRERGIMISLSLMTRSWLLKFWFYDMGVQFYYTPIGIILAPAICANSFFWLTVWSVMWFLDLNRILNLHRHTRQFFCL